MPINFDNTQDWHDFDREHLWHPYTSMREPLPTYPVKRADGVRITLADDSGTELVDGMASWWTAIHGYNHPQLNEAAINQINKFSHVMFGGLAHEPASRLGAQLLEITPGELRYVFFADSGSVSVEVALKMAIQYWHAKGEPERSLFLAPRGGYHGDPFACMSVSDPENGMHHMFASILAKQVFVERPAVAYGEPWDELALRDIEQKIAEHGDRLAAVILEPIMQGAGGMRFYSPDYLRGVRSACDRAGILLIADEIATGFGRTGKMFACEHAQIAPDIMCVGKALTGGMMTLAATLTTDNVVNVIDGGPNPTLMHGPTFMANPLACSVASASIDLLLQSDWGRNVSRIERRLNEGLSSLQEHPAVADVRVLGAVGVVEMVEAVDLASVQQTFVSSGVWVRPFGKLIYVMPPYIIGNEDIDLLVTAIRKVVEEEAK